MPQQQTLARANAALQAGQADEALSVLSTLPQTAAVHNVRCRVLFALEQWNDAVNECQQAVDQDHQNAGYHLWLGRALGEKADRASFLSAYSLAKRVRSEFEQAASLDPRDPEILADLGEFYFNAPGIVGGGIDKADGIADRLDHLDRVRAEELRGRIADKRGDYGTAERCFKQALSVSHHPAFEWMTLASFYRQRQRWTDMESALQNGFKAAQHDPHAGVALFNGAAVLIRCRRDPALAAKMLEQYLAGNSKTEEAPAFVAHTRLATLKAELGDINGARQERQAALQLAQNYKPAQNLKF